jgi:pimeloyl-ACP methyl ester carboxylesterase
MRYLFWVLCVCALTGVACGESPEPSIYADKDLWLCRPDIDNDRCDQADLSITEIRADGTSVVSDVVEDPDAKVDCFYVYHTVDWSPGEGNTETLVPHPDDVIKALHRNGALYRGVCRMFAPVYQQMTLDTYRENFYQWHNTEFFDKAYGDVLEAFEYYLRRHNESRDFVLIGHSQGTHILTKLLQDKLDHDEALRAHLVSALLIGGGVPSDESDPTDWSLTNIPLCASANETSCVIAFDAIAAGTQPGSGAILIIPPAQRACVNPTSFDEGPGTLAALVYSRSYDDVIPFPDGVDTEWVRYPNIYTSGCSRGEGFRNVLEVDLASEYTGEVPITPTELQKSLDENWGRGRISGLHLAEYFIANTNLVRIVEQQIASREN